MVLEIDFKSGAPVYRQIVAQVQAAASAGAVRPGEALPAIGPLALELRVNRNAIAKAYSELELLGIIESTPERGYLLKENSSPLRKDSRRKVLLAGTSDATTDGPRAVRRALASSLLRFTPAASYLVSLGIVGFSLVRSGWIVGEGRAVFAAIGAAAVLLPLHEAIRHLVDKKLSARRENISSGLKAIETAATSASDMESFMSLAVEQTEAAMHARLECIRDYPSMLSLVNAIPSLRSARTPVLTGSDLLMPVAARDELACILRFTRESSDRDYDTDDTEFLAAVAEHAASAEDQSRSRREKQESEYASDIQQGLLPREIPQAPGFSIAGAWQPAKVVGGDYYDVFRLDDSRIALVIADVAGKGIPAALLMANLQATVRAYAAAASSPRDVCEKVNNAICAIVIPGKFITFFYAVLDPVERRLDYVNAGHNPPIVMHADGTHLRMEPGGMVLGIFPDRSYEGGTVDLLPGDRLVIFTDGITEAPAPNYDEFGEDGLLAILNRNHHADAAALRDEIMRSVADFCQENFADDATLLTVTVARE